MAQDTPVFNPEAFHQFEEFWGEEAPAVIREIVTMFLQETPPAIQTIERAYRGGDLSTVRQVAHRLKSNAGTVGAEALALLCREIERAADEGDADSLAERVPKLEGVYAKTAETLEAYLENLAAST